MKKDQEHSDILGLSCARRVPSVVTNLVNLCGYLGSNNGLLLAPFGFFSGPMFDSFLDQVFEIRLAQEGGKMDPREPS